MVAASLAAIKHRTNPDTLPRVRVERGAAAYAYDVGSRELVALQLPPTAMVETAPAVLLHRDARSHLRLLQPILASVGASGLLAAANVLLAGLAYNASDVMERRVRRLMLGMALELLFPDPDGRGGVTERVAMSFAHWLPPGDRKEAESIARAIYRSRSESAHGDDSKLSEPELYSVEQQFCSWFTDVLLAMANWLVSSANAHRADQALGEQTRLRRLGVESPRTRSRRKEASLRAAP